MSLPEFSYVLAVPVNLLINQCTVHSVNEDNRSQSLEKEPKTFKKQ